MPSRKLAIENFSKALNLALKNRFGEIPSAMRFASEFNLRAHGTKTISRETARKWMKIWRCQKLRHSKVSLIG
jgi:hypothetical protein